MRPCVILDAETTGLYVEQDHELWELGAIRRDGSSRAEHLWRVPPDLTYADPAALEVNRYHERTQTTGFRRGDLGHPESAEAHDLAGLDTTSPMWWSAPEPLARTLTQLLDDVTIVAANPTFDAGFLTAFLEQYGPARAPWHYRLRDIGSLAYGYLSGRPECARPGPAGGCWPGGRAIPPLDASTDDFAIALGVDPEGFLRHSALGDCLLAEAMLDVITGSRP